MANYSEFTLEQLREERSSLMRIIERERKTVDELDRLITEIETVGTSSNGSGRKFATT